MTDEKKDLVLKKPDVPKEVLQITQAIENGLVQNARMEWKSDGSVTFSADSVDGHSRIIVEKQQITTGFEIETTARVMRKKGQDRLSIVKALREKGMTQAEIARYTMTSQKTVSNDIRYLKENGDLR